MSKWKAPDGFTLTTHEGYHLNAKGFRVDPDNDPGDRYADGAIGVAWWNEDEPFTADNSVNVQILPIVDGWVPPAFELHADDDDTPTVEPYDRAGEA